MINQPSSTYLKNVVQLLLFQVSILEIDCNFLSRLIRPVAGSPTLILVVVLELWIGISDKIPLTLKSAVLLHQTVLEELAVFVSLHLKLDFSTVLHFKVRKLTLTIVAVKSSRCVTPIELLCFVVAVRCSLSSAIERASSYEDKYNQHLL